MLEALKIAHDAIKVHCKAVMEFAEEVGTTVKRNTVMKPMMKISGKKFGMNLLKML